MKNIIFIANNNLGKGTSGGDTIFLQFLKNWQNKLNITVFACKESQNLIKKNPIKKINIISTTNKIITKNYFTVGNLLIHNVYRITVGKLAILKNKALIKTSQYIYSVSDFYPDFIPALLAKIINPKIKWIVGYYLIAPFPLFKNSPYKNKLFLKGILYWLMQLPTRFIANCFADVICITSDPDLKYFKNKKVIVVKGGVDLSYAKKQINKSDLAKKYDAVFIGRLHPQKGVIGLIDIWNLVVQKIPNSKLAIIGDGELESQLKQKVKQLKLNQNIDILGFLDGQEKYKIFKQSKIVVHPAVFDSGGMSAAEAMAWGLPGVSYDLESLKTYYPKGMIKTPCFNQNMFAQNILDLLQNPKKYSDLSQQAQKYIYDFWDWQNKSQEIYTKMLN